MGDGEAEGGLHVGCDLGAEDGDGECLFGDPAFAEGLDLFWRALAEGGEGLGVFEGAEGFSVAGLSFESGHGSFDCGVEVGSIDDFVDDQGQTAGGKPAGWVAVSEGGDFAAEVEGVVGPSEADGCDAHDAAASLGVVDGLVPCAELAGVEGAGTGVARSAELVEAGDVGEPGVEEIGVDLADGLEALGHEPAPVGVEHDGEVGRDAGLPLLVDGADQAFGDEERHLGVVGEAAGWVWAGLEVLWAVGAEFALDLGEGGELDRGAEGVADCSGEEGAAETGERGWFSQMGLLSSIRNEELGVRNFRCTV